MPRRAASVLSGGVMKELYDERKFPAQFHLITPALVKLARDIMRFKAQSIAHLE